VKQDGVVLFQQKEAGSALDTGPVWIIADTGDGVFTARPRQWTDVVVERVRLPPARWGSASGLVGPDRARGHCGRNRRMNRH
jgi:hypothetical protein